ncbi:MAG: ABC transporter permease [Roseovarius sp.]|uniref:ABC transporter permease n=1 Tax=Roseovarius sp. TaxID=1486281 RepID=UPI0032EF64F6
MTALMPTRDGVLRFLSAHAIVVVLAAVFLLAVLISDAFLQPKYLFNVIRQIAPVGIAAVGVTFVMILGGVDLSIGAIISLCAVVSAVLMNGEAANMPMAIAVTCLVGAAAGAFNGIVLAFSRVSPFILTLATGIAILGITQIFSGGTARGIVSPGFREFFNYRIDGIVPVLSLAFLAAVLVGVLIQKRTLFGQYVFLTGSNRRAAILGGLPVRGVIIMAYALSGLFGALGGLALLARSGVSSTMSGQGLEFQILAAIVLGGTTFEGGRGGVVGTLAGVLVLVIAFNIVNISGLAYHLQMVVMGLIIIAASAMYGQINARSQ